MAAMQTNFFTGFKQALPQLDFEEKLSLIEQIMQSLHGKKTKLAAKKKLRFKSIYGIGKRVWDMDAQAYVKLSREERF